MANRSHVISALIHVLFWAVYVISEYLANRMHLGSNDHLEYILYTMIGLPVLMIPTYFMVYIAVPRWLGAKRVYLFGLAVLASMLAVIWMRVEWQNLIFYLEEGRRINVPTSKMMKNIIRDYSIIALASCAYILADWRQKQKINEELVRSKAEAEMQLLKSQLHPHFLFNSLNNIYSLALAKSDKTADSILKLTDLLDYLVYWAGKKQVPLIKEVELVESYLDLEKLRHGSYFQLSSRVELDNESGMIVPIVLLPFLENCFKHGGINDKGVFTVDLDLELKKGSLSFKLENSKPSSVKTTVSGGTGLPNIRKRLQLVYPDHKLNITDEPGTYKVDLRIQLANARI